MTTTQPVRPRSTGATAPPRDRGRSVDHSGLEVLDRRECERLLRANYVGRVAMIVDRRPIVLPVNYRYADGAVVFRTAPGTKLWRLGVGAPAAFEIDGWDDAYHSGWSVVVEGEAHLVSDQDELDQLSRLKLRPWARGDERRFWIRITGALNGRAFG